MPLQPTSNTYSNDVYVDNLLQITKSITTNKIPESIANNKYINCCNPCWQLHKHSKKNTIQEHKFGKKVKRNETPPIIPGIYLYSRN